jgi:hypothetical protein
MKDGKLMRASITARGSLKLVWVAMTLTEIEAAKESIALAYRALSELIFPAVSISPLSVE